MAMDLSWLPPGQDANRLPLGMRVNNPGNIKYFKGLNYSGMLGPSGPGHTDQGDPQMTFDTPQSGMNAMSSLAWKKYQGGKRSPNALIAGQMGWTPGNTAAAANVARTMGISPDADMNLSDPKQMSLLLRALTAQEHGPSAKLYGDELYQNAATNALTGAKTDASMNRNPYIDPMAPHSAGYRRPAIGGTVAGGAPAGGSEPMPIEALQAPSGRYSRLADALLASGVGAKPKGWGELLNATGDLALGYTLSNKQEEAQKAYQSKLSQMLGGATTPEALTQTLIASGDEGLRNFGVQSKLQEAKEQRAAAAPLRGKDRFLPTPTGQIIDLNTMLPLPGVGPKEELTPDMKEYAFSMKQRQEAGQPKVTFDQWSKESKAAKGAEFGTSTKAFEDKDGKIQYMQFSKSGGGQAVGLPEGARWRPDVEIADTGTEFVPISKQTGQVIGAPIAKDVAGKQAQEEIGKARGQAIVDLPKVEGATNVLTAKIDQVLNDPYLAAMTGPVGGRLMNLSGDASRVQSRIDQLTGDAFLQAFGELKGGGAITEIEGAKAEKAKSRLATMTVNDPEYPVALKDFRDEVERLRDLARARAGGGSPAAAPNASAPSSGGYKVLKVH